MKYILFLISLVVKLLTILLVFGTLLTIRALKTSKQEIFLHGTVPKNLPDGPYKGKFETYQASWKGKKFDAKKKSGINFFGKNEKYPFKFYKSKGFTDTKLDVIKLDYNQPGNPFWLKWIIDEIVETEKGKYLGKVYLSLIPGIPFTVGYFELHK